MGRAIYSQLGGEVHRGLGPTICLRWLKRPQYAGQCTITTPSHFLRSNFGPLLFLYIQSKLTRSPEIASKDYWF